MIRDGDRSVSELMSIGAKILGRRHVNSFARSTVAGLQVEGTFPTGTHLVTVDHPISSDDGNLELAMYGSELTTPQGDLFPAPDGGENENEDQSSVGAIVCNDSPDIVYARGDLGVMSRLPTEVIVPYRFVHLRVPHAGHSPDADRNRWARIFISSKQILFSTSIV